MGIRTVQIDAAVFTEMLTEGWRADPGMECLYGLPAGAVLRQFRFEQDGILNLLYESETWEGDHPEQVISVAFGKTKVLGELQAKNRWLKRLLKRTVRIGRHWKEKALEGEGE